MEREEGVREIYEGEDVISYMQHREEKMMNDFRRLKEQNERKLELLEGELMRMDKKEDSKDQWIKDQLENIERRMDYVKTKNKRVQ